MTFENDINVDANPRARSRAASEDTADAGDQQEPVNAACQDGRRPAGVFAVDGAFDFLTPQITTDTEPGGHEHKSWLGSASPCVSSSSSSSASSGGTSVAGTGRGEDDEAAGQDAIGGPGSVSTPPASTPRKRRATEAPVRRPRSRWQRPSARRKRPTKKQSGTCLTQ
jgi:hypothetical protein